MQDELIKKLEKLKNINKEKNTSKERENNVLLKECIEALHDYGYVLDNEAELSVYNNFKNTLIFAPWGIDQMECIGL